MRQETRDQHLAKEGAASWEAIAYGWTERVRTDTDFSRKLILDAPHLALLGDVTGKRILDAGCGEGRFARMLAERRAKVTAFDLPTRMVELARAEDAKSPLAIDYHVLDMCDLSPFEDASFDVVVAYLTILDVEDYESAVRELSRVLVAGGQFVFSVVHPCFYPPGAAWEPRKAGTIPLFDRDKLYLKVDNYFPARELRFKMWPTAPAETINYHRPLSDYATVLRANNLLIRDLVEPVPTNEVLDKRDDLRAHLRAPYFIVLDCVKAAS
ncbi:MAG TPA: class I SAM-dependent methyltransferase [Dehalococcoidia bacterium]|nr:class I SAM-dependent methyltransferase [Dehalococcoidia bacterium]